MHKLTSESIERQRLEQDIVLALSTLKACLTTLNIAHGIVNCVTPIEVSSKTALKKISQIRQHLTDLEANIKVTSPTYATPQDSK